MTTIYLVVYPHPHVPPINSIRRYRSNPDTDASDLRRKLISEHFPRHAQDLEDAKFWKVSGFAAEDVESGAATERLSQWIRERMDHPEFEIDFTRPLMDFLTGDPLEGQVHILVVTPEVEEHMDAMGDTYGEARRMKGREQFAREAKRAEWPAGYVGDPASVKKTSTDPYGPLYGRPGGSFGPPTALFSPPLASLKHELDRSDTFPDSRSVRDALSLILVCCRFYDDGDARETDLHPLLDRLLGRCSWQTSLREKMAGPDGSWTEKGFTYLLVKIKDEPGLSGDPVLQGLSIYKKILGQPNYQPYISRSNFPIILLAIAGNRLTLSTAIFTDSIYADELLSIKLHTGTHSSENVLRVARIFAAIKMCADQVRLLYRNIAADDGGVRSRRVLWPDPTPHPSCHSELPNLEFFSKLRRANGQPISVVDMSLTTKNHALYLAKMKHDGEDVTVLVKFAVSYNESAHHLLASQDPPLAPKLFLCQRVIGDMFMVVMEYIPESTGESLRFVALPPDAHDKVRQQISRALELLHGRNLVFGDLREANVLYLPKDHRVMLIDFDMVGQDGEDRYPANLNPEIELGVGASETMEKSHDIRNLEKLMERISSLER